MKYQVKAGKEFPVDEPKVVFRETPLFKETLAKHKQAIGGKLKEFIAVKSADPLAKFGGKDQHFISTGILVKTGLIHAHLTHDISILYKRSGKNPTYIDLYAIATHDELGTGQPANIKTQKNMTKKLIDQEVVA